MSKSYFRKLFYLAVAVILFLAIVPDNIELHQIHSDKIKHLAAFFVLSLLLNRASSSIERRLRNMGALLLFGIFIEFVQYFFPHRTSSWEDVVADLMGILLFQLFYSIAKFIKEQIKKR